MTESSNNRPPTACPTWASARKTSARRAATWHESEHFSLTTPEGARACVLEQADGLTDGSGDLPVNLVDEEAVR
ncbi:hypothetical protein [Nocardioides sp.]|uniref:hypothetical protein n=1 Tax=Nocardioides sp. TaxID=35761 RepID=UPI002624051B|nr:hypothetical protein [Nocardioides sp.]MDI6912195.1 hypothetical protein [Nocardioides sp.]